MMATYCANCGLPAHRYGTNDTAHEPDKTACISLLQAQIDRLRGGLVSVANALEDGDTATARRAAFLTLGDALDDVLPERETSHD